MYVAGAQLRRVSKVKYSSIDQIEFIRSSAVPRRVPGFYAQHGKRLTDIVVTVVLAPILIVAIAVLWSCVRLSGHPGFYGQNRIGRHGKLFKCWKIRTMVSNADAVLNEVCAANPEIDREWRQNQKLRNDPRILAVGKFLRASSLDELPQFWNVLRGDMSLVGPRPIMVSQDLLYRQAGGSAYYHMRPAITGPWQVFARGDSVFSDRIMFDNIYWRECSPLFDFKLMIRTIGVVARLSGN